MNAQRAWRPRRGRYLKAHEAASLLASCETARIMHRALTAQDYELRAPMRPYLHRDGRTVTLRFVWRRRKDGGSVTLSAHAGITIEREAG